MISPHRIQRAKSFDCEPGQLKPMIISAAGIRAQHSIAQALVESPHSTPQQKRIPPILAVISEWLPTETSPPDSPEQHS